MDFLEILSSLNSSIVLANRQCKCLISVTAEVASWNELSIRDEMKTRNCMEFKSEIKFSVKRKM